MKEIIRIISICSTVLQLQILRKVSFLTISWYGTWYCYFFADVCLLVCSRTIDMYCVLPPQSMICVLLSSYSIDQVCTNLRWQSNINILCAIDRDNRSINLPLSLGKHFGISSSFFHSFLFSAICAHCMNNTQFLCGVCTRLLRRNMKSFHL